MSAETMLDAGALGEALALVLLNATRVPPVASVSDTYTRAIAQGSR